MIKTIESPDFEINDPITRDLLKVTIRKDYIIINCHIDDTGNTFKIKTKDFKQALMIKE